MEQPVYKMLSSNISVFFKAWSHSILPYNILDQIPRKPKPS